MPEPQASRRRGRPLPPLSEDRLRRIERLRREIAQEDYASDEKIVAIFDDLLAEIARI